MHATPPMPRTEHVRRGSSSTALRDTIPPTALTAGFNVPMNIYPTLPSCFPPSCPTNINPLCPPLLRTSIDAEGKNLGCLAACTAGFGQEKFGNRACCSGECRLVVEYTAPQLAQRIRVKRRWRKFGD